MTKNQIVELIQSQIEESQQRIDNLKTEIKLKQNAVQACEEAITENQRLLKEVEKINEPQDEEGSKLNG